MITNTGHIAIICVMLPLVVAVIGLLLQNRIAKYLTYFSTFSLIVLSVIMGIQITERGEVLYALGSWAKPLGIHIHIDGLAVLMLFVTSLLSFFLCLYSCDYFSKKRHMTKYFWPLCLFCIAGLNVLFLSHDLFNIYVAIEIISFSAISLVALSATSRAVIAATQYFFLTIIGSLMYLLGVAFIYGAYGTLDLGLLAATIQPELTPTLALTLMTIGLIIKAALFPMHFWLPSAHANAPAPVSAILSGLVVMGSFYLLVRLWTETFSVIIVPGAGHLLGVLAAFAIIGGSVMALLQDRLKMMLAYSTISQIGYMFLIFPLCNADLHAQDFAWNGGVYLAASHAFAKGAAFMVAGIILFGMGKDRVKDCYGMAEKCPLAIFAFALAGVSLMGLPPSGGFIGKWMLLKAALLSGQWIYAILIAFGSVLSAAYIFRIFEAFLHKPMKKDTVFVAPIRMQICALIIAFVSILLGLAANTPLDLLEIGSNLSIKMMKGIIL